MAQPLSIIQAALELALIKPTTAKQYKTIAKEVLEELRRAVEPMHFVGQLARFQQPASDVADVLLSQSLEEVISDLHRAMEAAEVGVLFSRPGREQPLRTSATRLRQMLFYVMQAVQILSQPGDVVHIAVKARAGHLALRIQHSRHAEKPKAGAKAAEDVRASHALALAEAITTTAGGEFLVTTRPLLIVADFEVKRDRQKTSASKLKLEAAAKSQVAANSQ